jgi:protocatechuate 3,4-dioxygenase beta subunit
MRSQRFAIAGLVMLLIGGVAAGVYWFVSESSDRGPRPAIANTPTQDATADTSTPSRSHAADAARGDDQRDGSAPADSTADGTAPDKRDGRDRAPALNRTDRSRVTTRLVDAESLLRGATEDFAATIVGRVIDDSGRGIAEAEVSATYSHGAEGVSTLTRGRAASAPITAKTDDTGSYEIAVNCKVPQGITQIEVAVSATAAGYKSGAAVPVRSVNKDERRSGADITLTLGGSIVGRVVDAAGNPAADVNVDAHSANRDAASPSRERVASRSQLSDRTKTASDGTFKFEGLLPGSWRIRVAGDPQSGRVGAGEVLVVAGQETRISTDFVVATTTSVTLRILNEEGNPIAVSGAGMRVVASFAAPDRQARQLAAMMDAEGHVTFKDVPVDALEFTVTVDGYESGEAIQVRLAEGQVTDAGEVRLTAVARETDDQG